jgi:hypothetical protein
MFDTEADKKNQDGLKIQAIYASLSILSSLVQADHPPISTDNLKKLADIIYTCFYSFHYLAGISHIPLYILAQLRR